MRRITATIVMYVLLLIILNVCHSDNKEVPPVNIIVIIDTSDRICKKKHPDQREKDIYILKEIVDRFYHLVDINDVKKGTFKLHKLTIVVPEQPKVSAPPNAVMEKLTVTTPKNRNEYEKFLNEKNGLKSAISELYDHVQKHPQTGSDIWDWFRSKAKPAFSKNHQNLIICLSDGYLNFDIDIEANRPKGTYMSVGTLRDDSDAINKIIHKNEGLRPVKNFSDFNIKLLMFEIRLREEDGVRYFQDFNIIQAYWKTWLSDMGIKDTIFFEQLDPRSIKNMIQNFIKPE